MFVSYLASHDAAAGRMSASAIPQYVHTLELALQKMSESRKKAKGKRSSWEGKGAVDAKAIKQALLA